MKLLVDKYNDSKQVKLCKCMSKAKMNFLGETSPGNY